jgi:hypothetical protein
MFGLSTIIRYALSLLHYSSLTLANVYSEYILCCRCDIQPAFGLHIGCVYWEITIFYIRTTSPYFYIILIL